MNSTWEVNMFECDSGGFNNTKTSSPPINLNTGLLGTLGREKRSFRRNSNNNLTATFQSDHFSLASALLDATPKRNSSQRSSKSSKKALFANIHVF